MDEKGIWHEILEIARWVPSPHNVQPWKVKIISEEEAELCIDTCRTLPREDPTGSFVLSAMGMFIEALRLISFNRSLILTYSFYNDLSYFPPLFEKGRPQAVPFARLKLQEDQNTKPYYEDALFQKRRTSRIPYSASPLPQDLMDRLSQLALRWNQVFVPIPAHETILQLTQWDTEALFEDMNNKDYRDEIVEYFRFSDREAKRKRDGLDFRCMNFSRFEFWLAARMPWLMKIPWLGMLMKKRYQHQFEPIHTMGFIAGGFWEAFLAFEAGRFLLHFWLEITRHDIYMHPFGNLVTNPAAAKRTHERFGRKDIWLIFRMGYSPVPIRSQRLHEKELLLD